MKIAFFHNLPFGGAKRVVYEQIKYLSQSHDIDLYQLTQLDTYFPFEQYVEKTNTYNFLLSGKRVPLISRIESDFKNFVLLEQIHKKIAQQIDRNEYDLVIVHPDMYTQAPFLLRYLRTKNIYYCHEWLRIVYEPEFAFNKKVFFLKAWHEIITRAIRKKIDFTNTISANIILANSYYTATHIKTAYGVNAKVCYPGVDATVFFSQNEEKNFDILFISDTTVQEGFSTVDTLKKLLPSKKIEVFSWQKSNILSDNELVRTICRSKIVLCVSKNEPLGLLPLEVMACGVPVIAVNEGGYRETVIDGKTGYLIPRDAKTLARKLDYLLTAEKKWLEMSKYARKYITEKWTWEIRGKELERILYKFAAE